MSHIPGLRRVFRLATRRAPIADDVDAELAFHFEMTAEHLERAGLSPEAARAEARRRFGDVEARRSELREIDARHDRTRRTAEWMHGLAQDLRIAARALRRAPSFAAVIVLTLALGIGANSMMFGIVDRLLLRPPAYLRNAESTGRVFFTRTRGGSANTTESVSYAQFLDMREGTVGALDLVGISSGEAVIGDGAAARQAHVGQGSGEMWRLFDARPALGRFFGPSDDRLPVGSPVAVLGYEFWQRTFGGDRSVLGRGLRVGGTVYTIVGVAPKGFTGVGLRLVDVWLPLTAAAASALGPEFVSVYNMSWFGIVARRHADVSPERANALLTRAYATSLERRAASQSGRAGVRPGRGAFSDRSAPAVASPPRPRAELYPILADRGPQRSNGARVALWVLGVAAIVLLVACANVTNLLLARALAREREVALRVALGVGKARLARQLLAEVALLAALGAGAGLLLARVGGALLTRMLLPELAWGDALTDGRTLLVTCAIALGAGVLASLAPSARALRPNVVVRLRGGAREGGERHGRTRAALVLVQASLSAVLLVGAGLFVRSLHNVRAVDFGFEPARALYASVEPRGVPLDSAQKAALLARLADRVRALPEVEAVGATYAVPNYQAFTTYGVRVPGRDSATGDTPVHVNTVGGDYFRAMGTKVLRGRVWDPRAAGADAEAVVVSAALARLLYPGDEAVGHCAIVDREAGAPCRPIIGVVADVRLGDPRDPGVAEFYRPLPEHPGNFDLSGIVVRTRGDAVPKVLTVQRALQPLLPGAAYVSVRALDDLVAPQLRPWRTGATLFAAFGALGLLVAAIGLYSALAYDVAQRRHDIGIRLALGAHRADVLALVVRRGVTIAVAGVAAGVAVALVLAPPMAGLLFGVSPRDPATLVTVAAILVAVAVVAAIVPGRRAARVDPVVALRADG